MGVSGLFGLVKSVHQQVHISEYAGKTVAVDGNIWLYKGAFACALDLALQKETERYVEYFVRQVQMLEFYGVILYIVFNGAPLPSKGVTRAERERRREDAKAKGREFLAVGKQREAETWFRRAVEVTPAMVEKVKKALDEKKVKNIIAPYEADAQLAYLMKTNRADAFITEDSDLLVFGCHTVIFKMDNYGDGIRIRLRDLTSAKEIDLRNWDEKAIRHLCIFTGCDYLPSLPRIGLKVAHKLLKKFRTAETVLQRFKIQGRFKHAPDYGQDFKRADQAFLYQYVYDPDIKQQVHLNILPADIRLEFLDFLGTDGHTHNDASATSDRNNSQQQQPASPASSTGTNAPSPSSDCGLAGPSSMSSGSQQQSESADTSADTPVPPPSTSCYLAGLGNTSSDSQQQPTSLASSTDTFASFSSDSCLAGSSDASSEKSTASLTTGSQFSSSSGAASDERFLRSLSPIPARPQALPLSEDTEDNKGKKESWKATAKRTVRFPLVVRPAATGKSESLRIPWTRILGQRADYHQGTKVCQEFLDLGRLGRSVRAKS